MPMKFVTTLERDEDGVWVAECPSIPGCVSQEETRDEALPTSVRPLPPAWKSAPNAACP